MKELLDFYNYINVNKTFNCVNFKTDYGFSKNLFIENKKDLIDFCKINYKKDCYINYQPLIEPINRKTENVLGVNVLAFDIEYSIKIVPETPKRKKEMLIFIYKLIYYLKIKNYLIVDSGNGYHLYLKIGNIIKSNKEELKSAYKNIIKYISEYLFKISSGLLSSDDRKDLAGILRIPLTYNTKAKKYVKVIDINDAGENKELRLLFFRKLNKISKEKKLFENKNVNTDLSNIKLPKNIDELILNPLVKIWFDKTLEPPKHGNWHSSIIFALQALIYQSGLSNDNNISELSKEINNKWGTSSDLSSCSYKKDLLFPINCAIRFCNQNGYTEYEQELKKLYIQNEK